MFKDRNSARQADQPQLHRTRSCFGWNTTQLVTTTGLAIVLTVVASSMAYAGTGGTEFAAINTRIEEIVEGGGGLLITSVAVFAALAAMAVKGWQFPVALSAAGIGAGATYGLGIVTSTITALI